MRKTVVIVFLNFVCALCALAQDAPLSGSLAEQDSALAAVGHGRLDSMQYIQNVIIYGRRPYEEVIPAQVLTGKQLEGLNSHSVADAVRYFAGVQLKDYGGVGGIKTINVRSMGSQHTAVYYNGVQLGNAQNGQVDLGRFSLDNMEQIDLFNGQKSDIFQSAREFGAAGNVKASDKLLDKSKSDIGNSSFQPVYPMP